MTSDENNGGWPWMPSIVGEIASNSHKWQEGGEITFEEGLCDRVAFGLVVVAVESEMRRQR